MLYFYINSTERGIWSLTGPYGVTRYASIFHSFIFPEYILPSALCTSSLSLVEGGSKSFDWSQNRSRLECSMQAMLCSTQHCAWLPWVLLFKEKSCLLGKSPFPRIHVAVPWKFPVEKICWRTRCSFKNQGHVYTLMIKEKKCFNFRGPYLHLL